MFKVVLNDGQTEMPDDPVYYVIGKEGVYLKKTLGIMDSLAPVKQISTLQSVATSARMHISKIPGPKFAKIIEFFRAVHKEYYAEAIVLLFYDEVKQAHTIIVPNQKVSGGSCDYNRGITIEGLTMIGTIHSHGGMSAFHSGTDDKDEESFDGLHITIGNMRDEEVSISASIVANGHRVMVDPCEYVDKLKLTQDVDEKEERATTTIYTYKDGKLVKDEKKTSRYTYSHRKYDKRYVVQVTDHQKRFNQKWMKKVEKGTYTYHRAYGGAYGNQGWGSHYDSWAWGQHQPWRANKNLPSTVVKRGVPPQNVGPQKTPGVVFPEHEDEDFNPCENCMHRDDKIQWAIEQYTDEVDEPDEEDLKDNFVLDDKFDHMFEKVNATALNIICAKCNLKYNIGLASVCPGCGEAAPDEIDMKDVEVAPLDPVIGRDFSCPTCGNTFTHKGKDICPFCDEELDFDDYRKEALSISDEEIEAGEYSSIIGHDFNCPYCSKTFKYQGKSECSHCKKEVDFSRYVESRKSERPSSDKGNLIPDEFYACIKCDVVFMAEAEVANCPNCDNVMIDGYNCSQYEVDETKRQMQSDAGEFLHGQGDEFTEATLNAAIEEDSTLEQPLPDPEKDEIPLSTRVQETSKQSLKEMFKKVFGREGKK